LGYLTCRRCRARIDLPHIKHVWQAPVIFSATCPRCGRHNTYSYVDLKGVEYPTREEVEKYMQLRYIVEYGFFVEGVRGALESMVIMARRIREELERRRQQLQPPETTHVIWSRDSGSRDA
jgi:hypothetical protein